MRAIIFGILVSSVATAAMAADERTLPRLAVTQPQSFGWIEGGWSSIGMANTHAFDASPTGTGDPVRPVFFKADNAAYGRAEVGIGTSGLGLIHTISVYGNYRGGSKDAQQGLEPGDIVALGYRNPSTDPAVVATALAPQTMRATQKFNLLDGQVRLKHNAGNTTVSIEPFVAQIRRDVFADIDTIFSRGADIKGTAFGTQVALEQKWALHEQLEFRGRASIGAYRMKSSGDFFFSGLTPTPITDAISKSIYGFRAGIEIGTEWKIAPGIWLGMSSGIDYWSRMPSAGLSIVTFGQPIEPLIGIEMKSFVDAYIGARLTFRAP